MANRSVWKIRIYPENQVHSFWGLGRTPAFCSSVELSVLVRGPSIIPCTCIGGRVSEDFSGRIPPGRKARIEISSDANSMYSSQFTSKGMYDENWYFTWSTTLNKKVNEKAPSATPALFAAPPMMTITQIQKVHSIMVQVSEPTDPT